jgi:alkanesulfonate monooxygenase SsuD/methylene tetrahydromethanopterin reductase-like flavin-dependent oxidoreductase (luciferase family)
VSDNRPMYGLGVPNGGDFADPRRIATLAAEAEAAGWDGFFIWDHVIRRPPWKPMIDPWVALAAVAVATNSVIIGPMVTPLARRRTSVLARETATLDVLCEGRLRLGVGLGAPDDEFTRFGESADPKLRARVLDESLELLELLWSGENVNFAGDHVVADGVQFLPRPVHGRVPIWVAGGWPGGAPFRRAARYDGVWPVAKAGGYISIEEFGDCVVAVEQHRAAANRAAANRADFDYIFVGRTPSPDDSESLDSIGLLADFGMTWWIESLDVPEISFEEHRARVQAGPPDTNGV